MRLFCVFLIACSFASCASHQPILKSKHELTKGNSGVIIAKQSSFFDGMLPSGVSVDIVFQSIDSNKLTWNSLDGYPTEIEVSAGDHEIEYACFGTINLGVARHPINNVSTFMVNVSPGVKYLVAPNVSGFECTADVKPLSDTEG